jgi:hypothetical protein
MDPSCQLFDKNRRSQKDTPLPQIKNQRHPGRTIRCCFFCSSIRVCCADQEKKRNYERMFVAEIRAGAVVVNGSVAPSDGFTSKVIMVLAGTGAIKNVISA